MLKISPRLREGMERMTKAAGGMPDRVPVYAQMSHHSAKLAGESTFKFFTNAETFLKCQLHADELYHLDSPTIHYDCYNIEAEALGAKLVWATNQFPEVDPASPLMASVDDVEALKPLKMGKGGRMPYVLEINKLLVDLGVPPKIRFCGPFSLAAKLVGFENFVVAAVWEPDQAHRLLRHLTDEVLAPWITFQRRQCGVNETAVGADALASPPMLTVPMIREFCLEYMKRLEKHVGRIRLAGLWGERFVDDPRQLLDIKKEGCPNLLQALDPDVTALGPAFFKEYADQWDMAIIMGLDATLLQNGPVGEIKTRAGRFINEAGRDGRFVLYMNDIPYETPPEHVHAVVSVAHEYRYD